MNRSFATVSKVITERPKEFRCVFGLYPFMGIQWSVSCGWQRKGVLVNFPVARIKIHDTDNFREQGFIWHRL